MGHLTLSSWNQTQQTASLGDPGPRWTHSVDIPEVSFLEKTLAGGYPCCLVSISSPELAVAVPSSPVCLLSFLLTQLVTSASGLSSLAVRVAENTLCGWRRSGKACLHTGLLPELSAQRSCLQEPPQELCTSACVLLFQVSSWSWCSRGKLKRGRNGAAPF